MQRLFEVALTSPRDNSPNLKGAYRINNVGASTRADDVAQADDAVAGRAGRIREIPEATVAENLSVAEDSVEATDDEVAQDTTTPRVTTEPDLIVHDGAPIAQASYVEPAEPSPSPSPTLSDTSSKKD